MPRVRRNHRSRPLRARLELLVIAALLLFGCSSDGDASTNEDVSLAEALGGVAGNVSTTVANRPPDLRVPSEVRAEVGTIWSDAIVAIDPDGDEVSVRVAQNRLGFFPTTNATGLITGFEFRPTEPGRSTVDIIATDSEGNTTILPIELTARYPRDDDLFLAMGDSVSAGFGRDRSDFLGPDGCYRSEQSAYPSLVFDQLVAAGSLSSTAEYLMVSCSSGDARSLIDTPVKATDRSGSTQTGERPQLDWAIEQNPTVITLTLGVTDIQFVDPDVLFVDDADDDHTRALREDVLSERLDELAGTLDEILQTITDTTDAHVAVTTSYNPTAIVPVGVDGCGAVCFRIATTMITERLNAVIVGVVEQQEAGRVALVDIEDVFEGHEATNGFGPDIIRETNFGPFQGLISQFTGDTFPFCSDQDGNSETFITRLDCAHPNGDGQAAIATAVFAELALVEN